MIEDWKNYLNVCPLFCSNFFCVCVDVIETMLYLFYAEVDMLDVGHLLYRNGVMHK